MGYSLWHAGWVVWSHRLPGSVVLDLSSPTRDQTSIPYIARWIHNHWTTWEVPTSLLLFVPFCVTWDRFPVLLCTSRGWWYPLSMGFPWQEYQSVLPCPPLGDLPDPVIEPRCPTLQADSLPFEPLGKPIIQLRLRWELGGQKKGCQRISSASCARLTKVVTALPRSLLTALSSETAYVLLLSSDNGAASFLR